MSYVSKGLRSCQVPSVPVEFAGMQLDVYMYAIEHRR